MTRKHAWTVALLLALLAAAGLGASAQESGGEQSEGAVTEELNAQILINIPAQGLRFSDQGELLLTVTLTNLGNQVSSPLNLMAIVLNDCILPQIAQTCRFASFGMFEQVTPNGIPPGTTVQWTFNFGPTPQIDLNRWSVIWYQVR